MECPQSAFPFNKNRPLRSPSSRRIARRTWLRPFLWWNKLRRGRALAVLAALVEVQRVFSDETMAGFVDLRGRTWSVKNGETWRLKNAESYMNNAGSTENMRNNGGFGWFQLQTHCKILEVLTVFYGRWTGRWLCLVWSIWWLPLKIMISWGYHDGIPGENYFPAFWGNHEEFLDQT